MLDHKEILLRETVLSFILFFMRRFGYHFSQATCTSRVVATPFTERDSFLLPECFNDRFNQHMFVTHKIFILSIPFYLWSITSVD